MSTENSVPPAQQTEGAGQDHATNIVPLSERRSPFTIGLLWITMVTGFPAVLAGFDWHKAGYSLPQVLLGELISVAILLAYTVPAAYLGSKSGQTYALLTRRIFGKWGSYLVTFNLLWICIAWYGLTAVFLGDGLRGLFPIPLSPLWLSVILAVAMAFNNFFGFTGIANFARYLAAPVLIAWVGVTFFKAIGSFSPAMLLETSAQPFAVSLTTISAFNIGYATWGNEADYWRYGKPKVRSSVIPLVVAMAIGQIIFPTTGWMLARLTGVTDYASATQLMVRYAFAGLSILAAFVLIVSYMAVNDSGLYGAINAVENAAALPRKQVVFCLAVAGAIAAAFFSLCAHAFEWVASLSCIFLPSATVIMVTEWFVLSRFFASARPDFSRVANWSEVPAIKWPATIALCLGCAAGVATAGILPGTQAWHVGVCPLHAWLTSALVYVMLRFFQLPGERKRQREELERLVAKTPSDKTARGSELR